MKTKEYYENKECSILYALRIIGGKWRVPILWKLSEEPLRYNELKRQVKGITNIMLTRSLKEMEEVGLIIRKEYGTIPPHVEYSLTGKAKELIPALEIINSWGETLIEQPKGEE